MSSDYTKALASNKDSKKRDSDVMGLEDWDSIHEALKEAWMRGRDHQKKLNKLKEESCSHPDDHEWRQYFIMCVTESGPILRPYGFYCIHCRKRIDQRKTKE